MSTRIEMPALGESVHEGTVSRWFVKEGDRVSVDQPLVEISTDKADTQIESPIAGVVASISVPEGATVPVGTMLCEVSAAAPSRPGPPIPGEAKAERPPEPEIPEHEGWVEATPGEMLAASERARLRQEEAQPAPPPPPSVTEKERRLSPVVRKLAREIGVDLTKVPGTGADGRITREDVLRFVNQARPREEPRVQAPPKAPEVREERAAGAPRPAPAPLRELEEVPPLPWPETGAPTLYKPPVVAARPEDKVFPMSRRRRLIAEHMQYSKRVAPHVPVVTEVDMTPTVAARAESGASLTAFVTAATVRALRQHPELNAAVAENAIVQRGAIHIGIAVDTPYGLVVPVIHHADRLTPLGLSEEIERVAEKARAGRLTPDDLADATFTVTNPGPRGNLFGAAVIPQPQVGILRMGELIKRPVVVQQSDGTDALSIRPMMYLCLSYDHRAVDGVKANDFLRTIKDVLEAGGQ